VDSHPGSTATDPAALNHGYQIAFWVLAAIAALASVLAAVMIEPAQDSEVEGELALEKAA
jgi:hypothetical protein